MDSNAPDLAQLVYDRSEIADTMHRFAFGLDHGDADTLASALADDCRLDFTAAGRKLGINFPVLNGRDPVVKTLIAMLGPLDTSREQSPDRSERRHGHSAWLSDGANFMPGHGPRQGTEYALLMN